MEYSKQVIEDAAKEAEIGTPEFWEAAERLRIQERLDQNLERAKERRNQERDELSEAMNAGELVGWLSKLPTDMPIRCFRYLGDTEYLEDELSTYELQIWKTEYAGIDILFIGYDDGTPIDKWLQEQSE